MRLVRIAIWTSGEPVSSFARACSLITSCLRSAVIDIVTLLFLSKVEPPDDPKAVGRGFDQCDRSFLLCSKLKPRLCGEPEQHLSMTEQTCLVGSDGEGRDVVQRRFQWKHRPRQFARLSGFAQKVQRNGQFQS